MRHITLTGYYAGETVCGAPKDIEGDTYAHVGEWLDKPDLSHVCPQCLEVWDSVTDEARPKVLNRYGALAAKTRRQATKAPRGFILYEGPSNLDGEPIVAIATLATSNKKTGDMVQVWILRADLNPVEATQTGDDASICGSCPHRHHTGGACYVNVGQAPNAVYKAYQRGVYPRFDPAQHDHHIIGRKVRLGAYGDPAAVPFDVMSALVSLSSGHTGYTHQAKHARFDSRYFGICQVSADTPRQAARYQAQGARTFRVALAEDSLLPGEVECLADSHGLQCIDCGLCDGNQQNVAIAVHGSRASRFKSKLIAVEAA